MVIINQLETYPDQFELSNELLEQQNTSALEETLSPDQDLNGKNP